MTQNDRTAHLQRIADEILHAPPDANIRQMMAPLTAAEADEVTELVATGARRLGYEAQLMDAWAERQRAKGRPEAELTFDNFVRDTGYLWRDELRAQ
jgi:hypothetical protein